MTTDTSEKGLERLICTALTGHPCDPASVSSGPPPSSGAPGDARGGCGWIGGSPSDYEREYCVDLAQLAAFLQTTQPKVAEALDLGVDGPTQRKFLARLQGEISKRGTIDVLRRGIKDGPHHIDLFYGTPSPGNDRARTLYDANRFSVTRQLRYSRDETQRALDLGLFINGLPVATFELKNSLTKQTVEDAVEQYKRDRDPRERLFEFGRCVVHFAVDDHEVRFCTQLKGKASWFLPFNLGWNDGAGNPPNPDGIKTDYLWKRLLNREGLTDILENYAQVVETREEKTGRKKRVQIWPRFHQLDVVRRLLADAGKNGTGRRYLIQHSAGSGKSNSIAWLAHQLIGLTSKPSHPRKRVSSDVTSMDSRFRGNDEEGTGRGSLPLAGKPVFDSIIVVTDRRILDQQIRGTIKQFAQVGATIGAVTGDSGSKTGQLTAFLESGKKIIITTVQTFPFILNEISDVNRGRSFAIIIDEAHSSQGGRTSAAISMALSEAGAEEEEETTEDKINRLMEAKKLLPNASYFAFTATPKNKTLEIFGEPAPQPDGKVKHWPFHSYTMKQAIQEGFILDVLKYYTPVESYYRLIKTVESDPEFDAKRAQKKLRRYVESHDYAIRLKAEIMVDHFHEQVLAQNKIGGQARAMVVTGGIERAVQYFHAIRDYLTERKSPHRAIVAFSGEHEYGGAKVTEASLNGFPSSRIADRIQTDPYRFLICAEKFQTGYDEPLLHTMYVDKILSGIRAVQTLSRLNRARPQKHDVFVLDFMNDSDMIREAFSDYYRTTILAEETDPNKLHDLKAALDGYEVYAAEQVGQLVALYLDGADRDRLDPILDACVAVYKEQLDEDGQVDFKGKAKAFLRMYGFLASILPFTHAEWEKLSIFLNFLVPKLPAPVEEDLSKGILEAIDMDSYRVEKQATMKIQLPDEDAYIEPVPTTGGGRIAEPEIDRLTSILRIFNDQFGTQFTDSDRIVRRVVEEIAPRVGDDSAFKNAKTNSDKPNARIEHDKALSRVVIGMMKDDTELFKQFMDNESFKRWMTDTVFALTYDRPQARIPGA